jgi:hypothetical protein
VFRRVEGKEGVSRKWARAGNGACGVDTLADKSKDATRCGEIQCMYVWKVETTLNVKNIVKQS